MISVRTFGASALSCPHRPGRPAPWLLLLALTLVLPEAAVAQTLDQTVLWAYQNNPQIQAERARQRGTDEQVTQAKSGYRPLVELVTSTGRAVDRDQTINTQQIPNAQGTAYVEDTVHTVTPERRDPHSVTIAVQQPLFDSGKTAAAVDSAEWLVKRGLAVLQSVEASVLGSAVTAYYDLYRDQAIVDLEVANARSLQRELEAVRARYQIKDVTGTDIAQSEARLARGIADRAQAEGTLAATRSNYLRVVGVASGKADAPPPLPADLPKSRMEALSFADNSPDVAAARFAEAQARANVDGANSALYPSLSLNLTASRLDETDLPNYARDSVEVLLQLKIPLYDGGTSYSHIRGAKLAAEQTRSDLDNTRNKVVDQIERSWQALITARSRIVSLLQQTQASELALNNVGREVLVGTRTVLDQLNAEQELLDAKVGLVQARHDEAVAAYSLLVAIGRFSAASLNLPVDIYDAKANYEDVSGRWFGTGIDAVLPTGIPPTEKP